MMSARKNHEIKSRINFSNCFQGQRLNVKHISLASQLKPLLLCGALCTPLLSACTSIESTMAERFQTRPLKTAQNANNKATPQQELQRATAYWAKEFSKNSENPKAALAYARNLKAMGDHKRAFSVMAHAHRSNPQNSEITSEYGRLALVLKKDKLAARLLNRAETPGRNDWRLLSAKGTILAKQGRIAEARALFQQALTLAPNRPSLLNNLALTYALEGKAQEAENLLRKASSARPSGKVRQNLALVLGLQGQFEKSRNVATADLSHKMAEENTQYLRQMVRVAAKTPAKKAPAIRQERSKTYRSQKARHLPVNRASATPKQGKIITPKHNKPLNIKETPNPWSTDIVIDKGWNAKVKSKPLALNTPNRAGVKYLIAPKAAAQ